VITFFDLISTSAPHIYISALPLSPRGSIVQEVYGRYARPSVRVVRGLPVLWDPVIATSYHKDFSRVIAWSPCNRFIAIAKSATVEVLDAVTLQPRLNVLESFLTSLGRVPVLSFSSDSLFLVLAGRGRLVSCDLQTGGLAGATSHLSRVPASATYSMDRRILAIVSRFGIAMYNFPSMTYVRTLSLAHEVVNPIWTDGEYLRFATMKPGSITVWQVPFNSRDASPTQVESLPIPNEIPDVDEMVFLPSRSRLAFSLDGTIFVWDAEASKLLLNFKPIRDQDGFFYINYSAGKPFSSGGRFFACTHSSREVRVWKESPDGYILSLSPDGESIINFNSSVIHLLHTKDRTLPDVVQPPEHLANRTPARIHLEFSTDDTFAAFILEDGNKVMVLDLQSGDVRLVVDVGMRIMCVRVTESIVVVAGEKKIVTWNIPVGDCAINFTANTSNSIQTTMFVYPPSADGPLRVPPSGSISPDLSYLAVAEDFYGRGGGRLEIYNMSTGEHLAGAIAYEPRDPWFAPGGREVWVRTIVPPKGWKINEGSEPGVIALEPLGNTEDSWTRNHSVVMKS
jgi:WD40 repeat protein